MSFKLNQNQQITLNDNFINQTPRTQKIIMYGVKSNENLKVLINSIVEVGTVSMAAKTLISALIKVVPIAGPVLNAIIAGTIVAALGEGTIYIFEQIYLGNKSVNDIDWVKKVLESKLSGQIIERVKNAIDAAGDKLDVKKVMEALLKGVR